MKVVCINNEMLMESKAQIYKLTVGKIYEVRKASHMEYEIINDEGNVGRYFKERFSELEKYRNEKIEKILK